MIEDAIDLAREAAEALMDDTCTIGRSTRGPLNRTTGRYTHTIDPVAYPPAEWATLKPPRAGICRLKFGSTQARDVDAAGQLLTAQSLILSLPVVGSEHVERDMVVDYLTSAYDPSLIGRRFRIVNEFGQTHASARRFQVEEIV